MHPTSGPESETQKTTGLRSCPLLLSYLVDEELHLGSDLEPDDTLAVVLTPGGHAVLAPRSIRNLRGEAVEVAAELQATVAAVEQGRLRAYELASELRSLGASWGAIGFCLGVSESRARQIVAEQSEREGFPE